MTEKNRADLKATVVTDFPTTGTKDITAAIMRPFFDDMIDSSNNVIDDLNPQRTVAIDNTTIITNGGFRANFFEVDTNVQPAEFNVTMPSIASSTGQRYTFTKTTNDTKRVLIFFNGAETANGFPRWQLNAQYDSVTFIPNGTGWFVVVLTPHIKTVHVVKDATVQPIVTGIPTVVSWQTIVGESPLGSFDNTTNFDWNSKNGGYNFDISLKMLQLDANELLTVCLRFNGLVVDCAEARATFNNQDVSVRLQAQSSTFGPSDTVLTGNWDVTVEHNHGSNLNLDTDTIFTYWKTRRDRF